MEMRLRPLRESAVARRREAAHGADAYDVAVEQDRLGAHEGSVVDGSTTGRRYNIAVPALVNSAALAICGCLPNARAGFRPNTPGGR